MQSLRPITRRSISIHPPARGGTLSVRKSALMSSPFQSTHPQGVGPLGETCQGGREQISIHPPARGGTSSLPFVPFFSSISIHPPARGGTFAFSAEAHTSTVFQSTHPQGVGPRGRQPRPHEHTDFNPPTRKGWDFTRSATSPPSPHFNPPTRKGWDQAILGALDHQVISIHPPARGGTHGAAAQHLVCIISIHPPARGGTFW